MQVNKDPIIDGLKAYARETRQSQRADRSADEATPGGTKATGEDQVVTSGQSSLVERALRSESLERQDRIERLTRQVESGDYEADAEAVARAMVDEALGLSGDQSGDT